MQPDWQANQERTATYHACQLQTNTRGRSTCRYPLMFDLQISTASAYRPALAEHNEASGRTVLAERAANPIDAFIQPCGCMRLFGQQRPPPEGWKR